MLRLVHHTEIFGPLCFEYSKRVVRVGSCSDNDLILPHPSVRAYHCALVFDDDTLRVVPAEAVSDLNALSEEAVASAPCYQAGDALQLGELVFQVEHSTNSMLIPDLEEAPTTEAGLTREGYWLADFESVPDEARWLCTSCALRFTNTQVHVLGLVAHRKYALCPRCSQKLELLGAGAADRSLLGRLRKSWRRLARKA
jgi:hypothetical protein